VRYEVVSSVEAGRRRSFSGTCEPAVEPRLSFKVNGTIARRPVNMGDRVRRGQLIAELDPSDFQLQVEEAAAALRRAEAEAHLDGLSPKERGFAYSTAVVALGERAPADWRRAATLLLFAQERPYFAPTSS